MQDCRRSAVRSTPDAAALSRLALATRTMPPLAPSGTRAIRRFSRGEHQAGFGFAEMHRAAAAARGANPLPRIAISPPGIAADGDTPSMRGTAVFSVRGRPEAEFHSTINLKCSATLQQNGSVHARHPIVGHDAPAAGKHFQAPHRRRLPNIENPKKYKSEQQIFPVHEAEREKIGNVDKSMCECRFGSAMVSAAAPASNAAGHFVDHHPLRIFDARKVRRAIRDETPIAPRTNQHESSAPPRAKDGAQNFQEWSST